MSYGQAARESLLAAESAFATQASQLGTKEAFLANSSPAAFVAEDGKLLNAQELWTARPAQPNSRLTWYPVLADVAQSGDIGYTTGPWTMLLNNQPQAAGEYVTVWRKQPDGKWKFAVDMAIERIGTAPTKTATVPQPRQAVAAATPSAAPAYIILDLDKKFNTAELLKPGETYQLNLSAEARLYRPGLSMMQGAAAAANMKNMDSRYFFAPTTGYLAAAGDLGYVVGTMRRPADAKHPEENGTYLRIWRREAVAGWRIVAEVFNVVPTPVAATATPASDGGPTTGQVSSKRAQ
jgi:ketosteroid isomerase-like protein